MELDDLKQPWKQSTENINLSNNNIMELIQNKSYGPIASLKRRFRKQLIILPVVVAILAIQLSRQHDIFSDVLFWCYVVICLLICGYFYFSYHLVSNMQCADCMVKANLEKQIHMLEKGYKWRLIVIRLLFVFFIVLLEVMLYFQQEPSLVKWYAQPLGIRLLGYAGLTALFYVASKLIMNRKYGKHIRYLKELVQQMQ